MNVFVVKAGATCGLMAGMPDAVRRDGIGAGVPASARKEPVFGLALKTAPVKTQRIE